MTYNKPQNIIKYFDNYIFLILVYIISFSINFYLPGIQMDVANHFAFIPGIFDANAAKLDHYRLPDNFFDLLDGAYRYPILGGSFYNTTISTYLFAFFFEIFGYSYETLRLANLLRGLLIFILIFYLLNKISITGIYRVLFFLLVLSNPDIIFSLKGGTAPWNHILFFLLGLLFFIKFIDNKKEYKNNYYLIFFASTFFGLSFISYFISIFYILPLVLILVFFNSKYLQKKDNLFLISGIFLGVLPLIYAYISVYILNPSLLIDIRPPFVLVNQEPILSINNFINSINLLKQGTYTLTKSIVGYYNFNSAIFVNIIFITAQFLILKQFLNVKFNLNEKVLFLSVYIVLILFFLGSVILKELSNHHVLTLQIVLIFQIILLLKLSIKKLLINFFITIIVVSNFFSLFHAHVKLQLTGGNSYFNEKYSTIPLDLSIKDKDNDVMIFTSWGFHLQFLFLTNGKKKYYYFTNELDKINKVIKDNSGTIVIGNIDKKLVENFKKDKNIIFTIDVIKSRDNENLFQVIKLKRI